MKDPRRTLLFLVKDDEILLAMKKRGFGMGCWNGVGGKIGQGESLEQALVRECQEEIKVTPLKFHKVGVFDFTNNGETETNWRNIVHTYFCSLWDGEPKETEEMKPEWFKIKDIPYKNMWEDDSYWLANALAGKFQKGTFTFNADGHMSSYDLREVKEEELNER